MVTWEIKHWNNFTITSVFYFTCNHVWKWNKIISAAKIVSKLFQLLKLFQNYFSNTEHVGKYSRAAINLRNNSEIISGKFRQAEIKLFQSNADEG